MRVLELTNVEREESELFYRRKYKCNATWDLPTNKETITILFTIETDPFGKKIIELSFPTPVNYPLIPVKKSLVEFILTEELEGRLPC